MPEMPEIESLSRFLADRLAGRRGERVYAVAVHALKTYDPPVTAFEGRTFDDVTRHGKFLDLRAGDLHLVVHLARAGWVRWSDQLPGAPPRRGRGPLALRVLLAEPGAGAEPEPGAGAGAGPGAGTDPEAGSRAGPRPGPRSGTRSAAGFDVTEAGTQKRLALYVVHDPAQVPGIARLGPDPLSETFTLPAFAALLDGERRQIKGVLRDQSVIAGIGNAYSDEILHAARMSPYRLAARLSEDEVAGLYAAIGTTLTDAVERSRGLPLRDLKAEKKSGLRVHGRTGQPCPVCGDTIREVSFSDSSLQYCPTCQTGGRPLADRRLSRLLK